MNLVAKITAPVLLVLGLLASGAASATIYSYSGVVTLCAAQCNSFKSLAVGSTLTGTLDINTTPNGAFDDTDMGDFTFIVTNPAEPASGPGDPSTDNPLILSSAAGVVASNGTAGTTDAANEINGGQMLLEFLVSPLNDNGEYVVFDLATGNGQICLLHEILGCIPGATEIVKFEGSFSVVPVPAAAWLFGSALLGLGLMKRRIR